MKTLFRLALRGAAVVAAYAAITSMSPSASAACWNDQKCVSPGGTIEDFCYGDSGTEGSHCHFNHGVCSGDEGNCEIEN